MDTDSYGLHKSKNIYSDIAKDVGARFETSSYDWDRPLSKRQNKKVIGLMKYEWGRRTMKKFTALRSK